MTMSLGGVTLDNDLDWVDEFRNVPIAGSGEHTIEGGFVTQRFSTKQGTQRPGRPITLSGAADHGWQKRSTVQALYALAEDKDGTYTLTLNVGEPEEVSYQVKFVHDNPVAFDPVTWVSNPSSGYWYFGTLKLVEVG